MPSDLANFIAGIEVVHQRLLPFGKGDAAPDAPCRPGRCERAELDGVIGAVRDAVWVNRLGNTFIIEISATSADPKIRSFDRQHAGRRLSRQPARHEIRGHAPGSGMAGCPCWRSCATSFAKPRARSRRTARAPACCASGGDTLTEQTIREINAQLTAAQADSRPRARGFAT